MRTRMTEGPALPETARMAWKSRGEGDDDGLLRQRPRENLLIGRLRHANVADVRAVEIPLAQQNGCVTRNTLVKNDAGVADAAQAAVVSRGCVLKIGRGKCQCLIQVFAVQFRIIPEEIIPVWIHGYRLDNAPNCQPHPADARLAIHLIRIPRNPVEALHNSHFRTFPAPASFRLCSGQESGPITLPNSGGGMAAARRPGFRSVRHMRHPEALQPEFIAGISTRVPQEPGL